MMRVFKMIVQIVAVANEMRFFSHELARFFNRAIVVFITFGTNNTKSNPRPCLVLAIKARFRSWKKIVPKISPCL
jgi:hypothetical protein